MLGVIHEPDIPNPPRFWWLKRLAVAYALLIAAMVGTWFAWDQVATRRFDAEVARLRGLGQPVLAADFNNLPPLPDDRNAAVLLKQAMTFSYSADQDDFENNIAWSVRLTDNQRRILRTFPSAFATQIQLARQARALNQANWGKVYRTPLINVMLPSLNNARQLANTLGYAAMANHLDGDDAEAIECLRDALHEADMVDVDGLTLVEHLVAVGINTLVCFRLDLMTDELAIDADRPALRQPATQPSTRPTRSATRQQVQDFIAELLDERIVVDGLAQAFHGEQAMVLDTVDWIARSPTASLTALAGGRRTPTPADSITTTVIRPTLRLSAIRMSQRHSIRAEHARYADFPAMTANLPDVEREMNGSTMLRQMTHLLERIFEPSVSRLYVTQVRNLAARRAAAIKLALRLYQVDHAGQPPDKLEALVPVYLKAIPADPFAGDGGAMGYIRSATIEDVETPLIYSVAENGTDEHASTRPTSSYRRSYYTQGKTIYENPYDREDLLFPLKQPPPANPAAPTTDPSLQAD